MHWPYHRPIQIWCKDRPQWCDLGPERDPARLLLRTAAHLAFMEADHDISRWAWDPTQWQLEAMALVKSQLVILALRAKMEAEKYGKTDPTSVRPANA